MMHVDDDQHFLRERRTVPIKVGLHGRKNERILLCMAVQHLIDDAMMMMHYAL